MGKKKTGKGRKKKLVKVGLKDHLSMMTLAAVPENENYRQSFYCFIGWLLRIPYKLFFVDKRREKKTTV